jgi:hypothetical protein
MLIPAFYGYSRGFPEVKYLYVLYPIFCILACFTFKKFFDRNKTRNLIFCLIIIGILVSSLTFISWKAIDNEHFHETYQILEQISDRDITINSDFGIHGSEFVYFHWTRLQDVDDFPILKKDLPDPKIKYERMAYYENGKPIPNLEYVDKKNIKNIDEYFNLLKKQQVTHLLLDEENNVSLINDELRISLRDIFKNEKDYAFLTKEYDSRENGFNYHLKLFMIDYTLYEEIKKLT